ncbi:PDZ domain-containing protein [Pontibacter sp. Tf4]|uniref:M61 family metallopeptidase n=1 Tax=Pontibacter sp. Tf4 TaxID=2761620 RepID=UPI00162655A9|nr:PDZ domain-containing protein [Pontibacter sp. Tf4]MBB6612436.1 PDZ domain-containing protein [Pontibacter sp. Tf4]
MKKLTTSAALLCLLAFAPLAQAAKTPELTYTVNLNDRADDRFKVTLHVKGLQADNNVFQFAATAPGTYQTMDMGRFVENFKAYDKKGREIEATQISTNQWQLSKPEKVRKITYQIAETFDTPVDKDQIYAMCGTSLEQDHALINGQAVFGYLKGLQATPMRLKLENPQDWQVGTALNTDKKGYYMANSYDHIVDSPIMAGELTKATTNYNGTTIDIYTYSKTGKIKSQDLMANMTTMLESAHKFVVDFPVDRYTFLYHFEDQDWGAWEHSYSSGYVMQEKDLTPQYAKHLTDIAAHEFFHIITPLNIHSEVIEQFNFEKPTPSQHLWLYEGTTEWASHIMQLRSGQKPLPAYLADIRQKLLIDDQLDKNYSLQKLALTSYTPEGHKQYYNIYNRGALVATLLDIRLLELSGGKRGLREVINELSKEYGPDKAFPENDFFNIFAAKTYPEIADFMNSYIKNAEPLPVAAYFGKLGINYEGTVSTGNKVKGLGYAIGAPGGVLSLTQVEAEMQQAGLQAGDELIALDGTPLSLGNANQVLPKLGTLQIGDSYTFTIKRNGEQKDVVCKILSQEEVKKHMFEVNEQATPQQLALRTAWMKNL